MTYRELYSYRRYIYEIDALEAELRHVSFLRSAAVSDSPHGCANVSPTARSVERCERLEKRIADKKREAIDALNNIDAYISEIEDVTLRTIFRRRFIFGATYEQIGEALYMDRRTVARKVCAYLAEHE